MATDGDQLIGHVALNARSSDAVTGVVRAVVGAEPAAFVARLLVDPAARRQRGLPDARAS